ncbi:subtilase-type protease inhibitor [Streptomyces sp. NPDC020681]|uniref:subtilase-type protease inhibitor n=1 Tax=Streptomyces sp. NPDC020681 TaxID=3365083 RepID=UPI0037A73511
MRYLRSTIATTAALFLSAAAAGTAGAQPAAQPAGTNSLYAPSALVLTIGKGETAATATVQRAVTLTCSPRPEGTHPAPKAACAELHTVNGEFSALADTPSQKTCTRQWDPVVVTANGVWQGKHVTWSAMYGNMCEMEGSLADGTVFSF